MKVDKTVGIVNKPVQTREGNNKAAIIKEAVDRALLGYEYHKENMNRAETTVNFIFGNQYSKDDLDEKNRDNRIALTFNKLPQFINKVTGAQRSSTDSIKVTTTGASISHKEPKMETGGGKTLSVTQIQSDLIRDIEYQSNAIAWYKMAFKHALEGGFGWLRVLTQYQDDGFDLDIRIKGIRDRWSVIIDPKSQEPDRSDMNWAFVSERISLDEFQKRYPGKSTEGIASEVDDHRSTFWGSEDTVTVSEYFRREPVKRTLILLSNGETHYEDEIKDDIDSLAEKDITILKKRKVTTYKVVWCKLNAMEILEEEIDFPTSTIPLVPVLGRETDFRNKKETKGLIDDAIDAQKALNRMRSSALERIDVSPLTPWIASDKAIQGHETMWAEANTTKFSTLVYRKGEEKPSRTLGATMPVAELQVTGVLDEDMKASIGIFNASLGNRGQEKSGVAIKAQQSEADVGTYEFIDNYKNAIRRVGLLCTELIPQIYDTQRIIRLRGVDGSTDTVEVNKEQKNNDSGEMEVINDLAFGKYSVVVTSGVSYETKREENADKILQLMKVNPGVAQVGSDLLVQNLDFADSEVLADRLTKMIPPNLLSKEKQEELAQDAPQQQGPTPEQQVQQLEMQSKQMDMQAQKAENDTKIQIEKTKLEIALVNKEIKEIELQGKKEDNIKTERDNEEARRQNIANNIVDNAGKQ